jgi:hypothetical protein
VIDSAFSTRFPLALNNLEGWMELTPEEVAFLGQHGYTPSQVFDGRGMGKLDRRRAAKEAGCEIVLTHSCRAEKGHRLATRYGHCFQCNPKQKAFENKHG